eukprot:3934269-Rhodomonas_salina.1
MPRIEECPTSWMCMCSTSSRSSSTEIANPARFPHPPCACNAAFVSAPQKHSAQRVVTSAAQCALKIAYRMALCGRASTALDVTYVERQQHQPCQYHVIAASKDKPRFRGPRRVRTDIAS